MSVRRKNQYQQSHWHYQFGKVSHPLPTHTKKLCYCTYLGSKRKWKMKSHHRASNTHILKPGGSSLTPWHPENLSLNEFYNFSVLWKWIVFCPLFTSSLSKYKPNSLSLLGFLFINTHSLQFSSVVQSCPTLCNPMNRRMPGLSVHHKLPEFTQTHVHQVGDAIQPSHLLSSPSPPAPNPSQHQGLFQWVNSSHEVAKVLEFQLQHQSFQWTPRTDVL